MYLRFYVFAHCEPLIILQGPYGPQGPRGKDGADGKRVGILHQKYIFTPQDYLYVYKHVYIYILVTWLYKFIGSKKHYIKLVRQNYIST